MLFGSVSYLFTFLPVVWALYTLISLLPRPQGRVRMACLNALLILASLLFYAWGEPVYLFLLLASVAVNWLFGLLLAQAQRGRRVWLALAVIINLGLLAIFKYSGFVVTLLNAALGTALPVPVIELPIGISFYTFQALSYVIDVYRNPKRAQKNGFLLLLYISFFPQLVAGPIVRYEEIRTQLTDRHMTVDGVAVGLRRFLLGLAKKLLIADALAPLVEVVFTDAAGSLNAVAAWAGALAYLWEIYFDFSGYSDMAIGLGAIFGFTLPENFRYPYAALGIKDFWRRWHITLSAWFKEYLYIPLGGNRKGTARRMLNQLIVFFCTGLWHGANLTFVVWGLYHGLFLILESNDILPVRRATSPLSRTLVHLYTWLVVTVGFVLFRADSLTQAGQVLKAMFTGWQFTAASWQSVLPQLNPYVLAVMAVALIGCLPIKPRLEHRLTSQIQAVRTVWEGLSYLWVLLLLGLCALSLAAGTYSAFIYFQF